MLNLKEDISAKDIIDAIIRTDTPSNIVSEIKWQNIKGLFLKSFCILKILSLTDVVLFLLRASITSCAVSILLV